MNYNIGAFIELKNTKEVQVPEQEIDFKKEIVLNDVLIETYKLKNAQLNTTQISFDDFIKKSIVHVIAMYDNYTLDEVQGTWNGLISRSTPVILTNTQIILKGEDSYVDLYIKGQHTGVIFKNTISNNFELSELDVYAVPFEYVQKIDISKELETNEHVIKLPLTQIDNYSICDARDLLTEYDVYYIYYKAVIKPSKDNPLYKQPIVLRSIEEIERYLGLITPDNILARAAFVSLLQTKSPVAVMLLDEDNLEEQLDVINKNKKVATIAIPDFNDKVYNTLLAKKETLDKYVFLPYKASINEIDQYIKELRHRYIYYVAVNGLYGNLHTLLSGQFRSMELNIYYSKQTGLLDTAEVLALVASNYAIDFKERSVLFHGGNYDLISSVSQDYFMNYIVYAPKLANNGILIFEGFGNSFKIPIPASSDNSNELMWFEHIQRALLIIETVLQENLKQLIAKPVNKENIQKIILSTLKVIGLDVITVEYEIENINIYRDTAEVILKILFANVPREIRLKISVQ